QSQGVACCDVVNRGAAYDGGRLFFNTLHWQTAGLHPAPAAQGGGTPSGQTVALDAATGHEVWRTRVGQISHGETITMAPLVAEGKVLVGTSGGEIGVRGYLVALAAGSGAVAGRAHSTG